MRRAYLSIDLDYGNKKLAQLLKTLKFAKCLNVSTVLVEEHDDILLHVKSCQFDTLLNMDEHSDLYTKTFVRNLNCGNWVNFVNAEEYIWIRSHKDDQVGRCDICATAFHKIKSQFSKQSTIFGGVMPLLKSYEIVGVGIAVSEEYTKTGVLDEVYSTVMIQKWFEDIISNGSVSLDRSELDKFEGQWIINKEELSWENL